ncbi:flagellar hook-length control protein FliK [Pseudoalteromonas gelatinilytica]|uniref:Flagellar hook-length control protein FliK n=1 Tax=Pseudoalteromonas gelatinilytica TaxID=1703256 RepID=A0ABQ1T4W7_9GAMM|nr:flagellar hook-length control protein FliK [Pseudoalteromonas profundi]GGE84153.1 flagellar hook-length control protein FliK [Pseudoalteromonas profundi]
MAISDINLQVKTEQGTGFSGKDIESNEKASGLSFLTSLTEASEAANAHASTKSQPKSDTNTDSVDETKAISLSEEPKSDAKLGNENITADAKVATASTSTEQQSKTSSDISNEAVTKEQSDELAFVEDEENSLLSQINAAQAMSTKVNKLIENNEFSPVVVDKKPTPIDTITPVIPSPMTEVAKTDDSKIVAQDDNSVSSLLHKSKVATAVDSQLKAMGDLPPKDSVTPIVDSPLTDKEKQGVSAVNTPDTKPQVANLASAAQVTDGKETAVEVDALLNSAQKQSANVDTLKSSDEKVPDANETSKVALNKLLSDTDNGTQSDAKTADVTTKQAQNNADKSAVNLATELVAQKSDAASAARTSDKPTDAATKLDQAFTDKAVTDKSIVSLFAKVQSGDGQAVSEFAKGLSLTSEQQKQLEQQINQLKADNTLGADEVATIKSLLTDVMSGKPTVQTTQSPVSQLAVEQDIAEVSQAKQDTKLADNKALDNKLPTGVEKQITALTKDEQQALLNKVNTQLQTLTPGTAQYEKLSAAQTVLTEAINTPATASTAMPVSAVTVNAENNKAKQNNAGQVATQVSEAIAGEEVIAEQEVKLNSERTQEAVTPRVAQLFNQLTTPLNTAAQTGAYEMAHQQYEQALDVQTMHTQTTTQTQAQSKSVSVDPGVMQAINIIKSDAAKMLQERVSALLNINNKEAEIRLDPPEMGSMQIRIRSDAEQAQINFVVQNQQAKEALEQSMPRLREMLAQQGIELGESSIQQGSPEQQDGQSGQGQFAGNQQTDEQQPEVSAQSSETSRQQSSSSIDYYA